MTHLAPEEPNTDTPKKPFLSNGLYDKLKFVAQIFLPALATLYYALANLWHLAKVTEVVGSISAVDIFLGVLLGLAAKSYNGSDAKYDGKIDVQKNEEGTKVFSLELNSNPHDLELKKDVTFKVNPS